MVILHLGLPDIDGVDILREIHGLGADVVETVLGVCHRLGLRQDDTP